MRLSISVEKEFDFSWSFEGVALKERLLKKAFLRCLVLIGGFEGHSTQQLVLLEG